MHFNSLDTDIESSNRFDPCDNQTGRDYISKKIDSEAAGTIRFIYRYRNDTSIFSIIEASLACRLRNAVLVATSEITERVKYE